MILPGAECVLSLIERITSGAESKKLAGLVTQSPGLVRSELADGQWLWRQRGRSACSPPEYNLKWLGQRRFVGSVMFYGVTRYSLFSPGSLSWKTSSSGIFKNQDVYRDYLFSDERLNLRAEMFLTRCVPALAAMAGNHDYIHYVMYPGLLPARHKELIFAAAVKYPFLHPVEWNEAVSGAGIEEVTPLIEEDLALKFAAVDGVQPVAWFRLDDDDLLAADYLQRLETYRTLNHVGMAISFGLGLTAFKTENELVNLREFYHPKSAQGMAFVAAFDPSSGKLVVNPPGPHQSVDQVMPTILDSREHMFFQVRHSDQDSTLNATTFQRIAASLARLEKLPALRTADISAERWPTLFGDLVRGEISDQPWVSGAEPLMLTEDTSVTLPFHAEAGVVEFEFDYESTKDLTGGFAVVSYELQGTKGIDAAELGLLRTTRNGFCRPVWSKSARGHVRQCLILPEGVSIAGVTVTGKNRQPAEVFIRLRSPRVVGVPNGVHG